MQLLLVEPSARHQGLGQKLIRTCLSFAREVGYRRITARSASELSRARLLYQAFGFASIDGWTHERYGPRVDGQTWALAL